MKNIKKIVVLGFLIIVLTSCKNMDNTAKNTETYKNENIEIEPTGQVTEIKDGLSTVYFEGEYGFNSFLENGGASSDSEVIEFLGKELMNQKISGIVNEIPFGCSTLSVPSENGDRLFGRNFDWQQSNSQIVKVQPEDGYQSISTVNLDFLSGYEKYLNLLPNDVKNIPIIYAPMDGMNEEGLAVAVLMIEDSDIINQDTDKPDLTTTTAIRLLLDKAASVDEAVSLLEEYDMNSSMNLMVHFSIADKHGDSIVVEYINNEMIVIETPIVTNFYLSEGEKNGLGSSQSHERFDILSKTLTTTPKMTVSEVKDALNSVSKGNFGEFESTEWSIIYNQTNGEIHYYHRENFDQRFDFKLRD